MAHVAGEPTHKVVVLALFCENKLVLLKMAVRVLEVDKARQHQIRENLHGGVDYPLKDIPKGAVHALG